MSKDTIFSNAPKVVKVIQRYATANSAFSFERPLIDLTQYMLLLPGDVLEDGDEFYYRSHDEWYKTTCSGQKVEDVQTGFYRRRSRIR